MGTMLAWAVGVSCPLAQEWVSSFLLSLWPFPAALLLSTCDSCSLGLPSVLFKAVSRSLGTARALKVTLTAQPIRLLGQHVGEPAKQNLLVLQPLTSLCLFIFPSQGLFQSKQGHIPQGFPVGRLLFYHTVGFSGWALRVGRGRGWGLAGQEIGAAERCCRGLAVPSTDKKNPQAL